MGQEDTNLDWIIDNSIEFPDGSIGVPRLSISSAKGFRSRDFKDLCDKLGISTMWRMSEYASFLRERGLGLNTSFVTQEEALELMEGIGVAIEMASVVEEVGLHGEVQVDVELPKRDRVLYLVEGVDIEVDERVDLEEELEGDMPNVELIEDEEEVVETDEIVESSPQEGVVVWRSLQQILNRYSNESEDVESGLNVDQELDVETEGQNRPFLELSPEKQDYLVGYLGGLSGRSRRFSSGTVKYLLESDLARVIVLPRGGRDLAKLNALGKVLEGMELESDDRLMLPRHDVEHAKGASGYLSEDVALEALSLLAIDGKVNWEMVSSRVENREESHQVEINRITELRGHLFWLREYVKASYRGEWKGDILKVLGNLRGERAREVGLELVDGLGLEVGEDDKVVLVDVNDFVEAVRFVDSQSQVWLANPELEGSLKRTIWEFGVDRQFDVPSLINWVSGSKSLRYSSDKQFWIDLASMKGLVDLGDDWEKVIDKYADELGVGVYSSGQAGVDNRDDQGDYVSLRDYVRLAWVLACGGYKVDYGVGMRTVVEEELVEEVDVSDDVFDGDDSAFDREIIYQSKSTVQDEAEPGSKRRLVKGLRRGRT